MITIVAGMTPTEYKFAINSNNKGFGTVIITSLTPTNLNDNFTALNGVYPASLSSFDYAMKGSGIISALNGNYSNITSAGGVKIQDIPRLTDEVPVNSIHPVSQNGEQIQSAKTGEGVDIINFLRSEKIRQKGYITKISLPYISTVANLTSFELQIWRRTDANKYTKIASSELVSLLSVGYNTIILPAPVLVDEGDFYGFLQKSSSNQAFIYSTSRVTGSYYTEAGVTDTDFAWESETALAYAEQAHCLMQAPFLCGIGDSIMGGYGVSHAAYVDPSYTVNQQLNPHRTHLYKLYELNAKNIYQNLGIAGETTTQILARFDSQVIAAKPKVCMINGGINDINTSVTKATYLANITSMLNKCIAANIVPLVWKITPWTNGINVFMQTRDDWNTSLTALIATYPTAKLIDLGAILGQYRAGGDVGNLWDFIPAYTSDGTHTNEAGHELIADEVYRILTTI